MSTTADPTGPRASVVVLAGGMGLRLRPHTVHLPKPLMPIGDTTVLELLLDQLGRQGFRRVTLALAYLGDLIEKTCGDGSRFGLELSYSRESTPLSTAGPLQLVEPVEDPLVVINGDLLTNLDFRGLVDFHKERGADATVAVQRLHSELDYEVVAVGEDGELLDYSESPAQGHVVSIGVNVLEPDVIDCISPGEALSMPDLILRLREQGKKVVVYKADCLWQDIGRPEHYESAVELFRHRTADFFPSGATAGRARCLEAGRRP